MDLSSGYPNPEGYVHVRTIIGIVLGLSIARLFTGLARLVQHPKRVAIYPVHLAWVLFITSCRGASGFSGCWQRRSCWT
jgi:hypothetical protein